MEEKKTLCSSGSVTCVLMFLHHAISNRDTTWVERYTVQEDLWFVAEQNDKWGRKAGDVPYEFIVLLK